MKFIHPQAFGQDLGGEGRATIEQDKECECLKFMRRGPTFLVQETYHDAREAALPGRVCAVTVTVTTL